MRTLDVVGVRRDKGVRTTIPAKDGIRARDLLNRDFTAAAPNQVWVTDLTYCRLWAGFVYVAFIIDVLRSGSLAWHASTARSGAVSWPASSSARWRVARALVNTVEP